MEVPETRYAKTADGVSIAYHVVGEGPVDILCLYSFMGGLEVIWEHEPMRSLETKLASFARVISHDRRATGLSGRGELPDLETQVQDVASVLDMAGSRSTVVLGAGLGAHTASLFAATYPTRTRALVLGLPTRGHLPPQRRGPVHPHVGNRGVSGRRDGAAIHVPTLVLAGAWPNHERDREVAEMIQGSTFVEIPGTDHAIFAANQDELVEGIRDFVGVGQPPRLSETLLRAVLFEEAIKRLSFRWRVGAVGTVVADHPTATRTAPVLFGPHSQLIGAPALLVVP